MTQPNCVHYDILLFTAQDPTNRLKGECHDHLVETQCNLIKKSHHIKYADLESNIQKSNYFYTGATIMWVENKNMV